jgi:hypothetical protein
MMSQLLLRQNGKFIVPSFYAKRVPQSETVMHMDCSEFMRSLGWKRVAHEWEVVKGRPQYGCGDMVFEKGPFVMIVEAKRRNSSKVYEQAQFYAAAWKLQYAQNAQVINYAIWTPATQAILGQIVSNRHAADIFWKRIT